LKNKKWTMAKMRVVQTGRIYKVLVKFVVHIKLSAFWIEYLQIVKLIYSITIYNSFVTYLFELNVKEIWSWDASETF
jgi:hypothetical protein